MMESLFEGELGLLGGDGGGLRDDGCGVGWRGPPSPEDLYSASHFALISAYQDIKGRLAGLERENSSIKRKLKVYEIKFPMISEFGDDRKSYCSFESKETALLQSENGNLQQRVNILTHELQKSKEREEQLEDVIQAFEKIHMEKSNLQRDLDKMTSLVEKHMERIHALETALRQRENSLHKLNSHLHSKGMQYLQLHAPQDTHLLECSPLTLQSSCSLDALSDLKLQRLEAELEGARHEAQAACQREEELKAECDRLQEELRQLQDNQREQDMGRPCGHCDVEWIKKVGDEQVNLALAYTELTEELGRLQSLSAKQNEILRKASQEQASPVQRHSPVPPQHHSPVSQRHSPVPQRHSPVPQRHSPVPQRRSPVLQRLSPDVHRHSPLPVPEFIDGPASYSSRPTSHHLRASFQGRRSYSEVADPSAYQRPPRFTLDPVSTLPKPRPYVEGYHKQSQPQLQHPSPSHTLVQRRGSHPGMQLVVGEGGGLAESPRHSPTERSFPLGEVPHLMYEPQASTPPAPMHPPPPPPQSSEDEEEWVCQHPISPPRTLGSPGPKPSSSSGTTIMRGPASCSAFPIPPRPNMLSCHPPGYLHSQHAQSWPSINLWMETEEESEMRSCPLCQLVFPMGYPDDALIKHIDSHLENSKI
ncbi:TANK-binding kinase 1-binding protein 1 [Denticeps clupeoides]|uniref:UBZ1-type domain-containing protein n=1 Tax=Denticeps clupeoides TaxID=299321 RepID=A0AAY4CVT4_9TELE|nr:TANK-binding kinase 1-binding protein 1 [Denticeps clupeoides]XP_028845586.1 TANK-binding kinase 1-binding protein 1 [Denticeps clupeoides]